MNPGDTITTTEINTEIKVEVQLETASIVKIETIKRIENTDSFPKPAIEKPSAVFQESATEKTREQIKAEREAKKLAKQSKKQNKGAIINNPEINSITNNSSPPTQSSVDNKMAESVSVSETAALTEDNGEKTREQIKAEREAKKLAKQAAKTAKASGNSATVATVTNQLTQVKISENSTKEQTVATNSSEVSIGEKVSL